MHLLYFVFQLMVLGRHGRLGRPVHSRAEEEVSHDLEPVRIHPHNMVVPTVQDLVLQVNHATHRTARVCEAATLHTFIAI